MVVVVVMVVVGWSVAVIEAWEFMGGVYIEVDWFK
jgi:hypothetical protein